MLRWCASAKARVRALLHECRAACGTRRRVGVLPPWISRMEGRLSVPGSVSCVCPAMAARASGRQVGWIPNRQATLRPQTAHRWRLCWASQAAGTSPEMEPAMCASIWLCMVWTERQPRARKGSAHGQVGTGQKIRVSTCIGPCPRGGDLSRTCWRSPPTGVPEWGPGWDASPNRTPWAGQPCQRGWRVGSRSLRRGKGMADCRDQLVFKKVVKARRRLRPICSSSQELHGESLVSSTEGCSGLPHASPAGPRAALRNAAQ